MQTGRDNTATQGDSPTEILRADSASLGDDLEAGRWPLARRRSFRKRVGLARAVAVPGSAPLAGSAIGADGAIAEGDVATSRFLAAPGLVEGDLWRQHGELGGVNGGDPALALLLGGPAYRPAQVVTWQRADTEVRCRALSESPRTRRGEAPRHRPSRSKEPAAPASPCNNSPPRIPRLGDSAGRSFGLE